MSVLYTPAPRLFADLAIAYGMSVAFATQSANCAQRTAGPDVNRTFRLVDVNVGVGRIAPLQGRLGKDRSAPLCGRSRSRRPQRVLSIANLPTRT
jgi:hypothetical protein